MLKALKLPGLAVPLYEWNISRNPGRFFALSITGSNPPAWITPYERTITSAIVIITLWIKSEVLAARNPPNVVYMTITAALITMAVK